jgi:hypothetical protein
MSNWTSWVFARYPHSSSKHRCYLGPASFNLGPVSQIPVLVLLALLRTRLRPAASYFVPFLCGNADHGKGFWVLRDVFLQTFIPLGMLASDLLPSLERRGSERLRGTLYWVA